ncbi:MAG: hypothetical protein KKH75_10070 [Actinobacteria bacterium]|nr:hypothetical protein [Actinomycetota bacterium]
MSTTSRRRSMRIALVAVLAIAAPLALTACQPEPDATGVSTTSPAPGSVGSPTIVPTKRPAGTDITLPASCAAIYSSAMTATLTQNIAPLDDPGVTMLSTQNVDALDILASGVPTLRCTWGTPSEKGLATNVSIITSSQAVTITQSMQVAGFACTDSAGGTLCVAEQKLLDKDDNVVTRGESHYFRGNGWISTTWIQYLPEGYTQDIVTTLWW